MIPATQRPVDEAGDPELGDLLDELVVVGGHVDMLVVTELGVDAQVLAGADRFGEGLLAAAGEVAGRVELEDASPAFRSGCPRDLLSFWGAGPEPSGNRLAERWFAAEAVIASLPSSRPATDRARRTNGEVRS